ncbi:uncharacterized protein [Argopecten irradians]|uniref:uncharacterized protein n=1 Tax=Argopecten irradians TaxID=31199 RepID=UPI00371A332C
MNAILLFAVAMFGALPLSSGHLIYQRKIYRPVIHKRIIMPPEVYYQRLPPTYSIQNSMGTVYPTRGHGPFYRPNFPANINTFHPRATAIQHAVAPQQNQMVNTGFIDPIAASGINPGFDQSNLLPMDFNIQGVDTLPVDRVPITGLQPGIGFNTKNVDADGKPVVQEQSKNEAHTKVPDSSTVDVTSGLEGLLPVISPVVVTEPGNGAEPPVITPVVITDAFDIVSDPTSPGVPDMSFPDVGVKDTDQILLGVGEEKQSSSCQTTGCNTGAECVTAEEYICPSHIPSAQCECRLGCRLDYTFIPLGGSITIDVCGNTCSCNNMYGAAECTQRMCKPEDPAVSIAGTVSSDNDLGGFQGAFESMPLAKTDNSAFDIPTSSSNRVTVPELQQFIEPMNVVEQIAKDPSLVQPVQDSVVTEEPTVGIEQNNVSGDVTTVTPSELSTESPLV